MPTREKPAASTPPIASTPSAGVIGSSTENRSVLARPTSAHCPQLIAIAGRPAALRHATSPSSHAFAHAYAA